ncbi:hypothetical protein [Deinococcus pimensis]|uniref:hypothetical protein n=1 Tax=Deinococcus pimensis TaxID=309888 RepID=UPI0004B28C82|nr:hypothetical protein [Deinococcus pimensis]
MNTLSETLRAVALLPLAAIVGACSQPGAPTVPTANLTVNVTGVPTTLVSVSGSGITPLAGDVTGSKTFSGLPRGAYTVTGADIAGYTTPAVRQADLSGGDAAVTLTYVKVDRAALTLSVKGVDRAPVLVTAGSTVLYGGDVTGDLVLNDLPRTSVTVTPQAVGGRLEPEPAVVDLTSGTGTATLTYLDAGIPGDHLQGTLQSWTGVSGKTISSPYSTTTVGTDGRFDLQLPPVMNAYDLNDLRYFGCGGLTVTDNVRYREFGPVYYVATDGSINYGLAVERPNDVTIKSGVGSETLTRIYADHPGTATGVTGCGPVRASVNLRLRTGWNVVRIHVDAVDADGNVTAVTYTTSPVVTASTFAFTKTSGSFNVGLDAPYGSLSVPAGGSTTVGATISTFNDFTGTVNVDYVDGLGQPVPGITVSPTSFEVKSDGTIAAASSEGKIGALGLRALGSTRTFTVSASADSARGIRYGTLRFRSGAATSTPSLTLNVQRSGFDLYFSGFYNGTGKLTIGPGESNQNTYAYVDAYDGFQGKVTLTLEGAPSGVSVSSPVVNVGNGSTSFYPTFNAALGTTPGSYAVKLVGTSGSVRAEVPFTLVVLAPTVTVSIAPKPVYQGETTKSVVTVASKYGFSGNVNLSAVELPAGVTLSGATTVAVPSNGEITVNLGISASVDATVGSTDVQLVGTATDVSVSANFTLVSRPRRLATRTTSVSKTLLDGDGNPWVFDPSNTGAFVKVVSGGSNLKVTVDAGYVDATTGGDGNIWYTSSTYVYSPTYAYVYTVVRIDRATGEKTIWNLPRSASAVQVDARGRVYYASGYSQAALYRYDTSTSSETSLVTLPSSYYGGPVKLGPDGNLYVVTSSYGSSGYTSTVTRVNGNTGVTTTATVPGMSNISSFLPGDGFVWVYGYTSAGARLAKYVLGAESANSYALPSAQTYSSYSVDDLLWDATGKIWTVSSSYALLFDPTAGTFKVVNAYEPERSFGGSFAAAAGTGLWYGWGSSDGAWLTKLVP